MGKITQEINNVAIRTGNTIATPIRIGGEAVNAVANIPRQGISSVKNLAEVKKQTRDALVHNFTNFSKVEGKWYEKMLKVPLNLVSAVTRRPAMIAATGIASGLNQGVRKPFQKLLYTPGKMFKGMRNATRIFNKEKGFDFATYDTHETKGDTWINQIKEKSLGFLGVKSGGSKPAEIEKPKVESPKSVEKKQEKIEFKPEAKPEAKPVEENKIEKPVEKTIEEKTDNKSRRKTNPNRGGKGWGNNKDIGGEKKDKSETPLQKDTSTPSKNTPTHGKPKSIDDVKKQEKEESEKKDQEEQKKNFPDWKSLDKKEKAERKKEYAKMLKNNFTPEGVVARGKEAKMGETPEEILKNFKEKDPTFVGYAEEEILKKAAKSLAT